PDPATGKPVSQAPPKGERATLVIEPVPNVFGEKLRPLLVRRNALLIAPRQLGVDQPIKMHGKGDVMVDPPNIAIAIPPVTQIKPVQLFKIFLGQRPVEL